MGARRRDRRRRALGAAFTGLLLVFGTNACARIGYDLVEPLGDESGAVGSASAGSSGSGPLTAGAGGTGAAASDAGATNAGDTGQVGGLGTNGGTDSGGGSGGDATSGGVSGTGTNAGSGGSAGLPDSGGGTAGTGGDPCTPSDSGVEHCDGKDNDCSGVVDDADACDSGCTGYVFSGRSYMHCTSTDDHKQARATCSGEKMRLARVDDSAENEFLRALISADTWLGGRDVTDEGTWRWTDGEQFWSGTSSGGPVAGRYENFDDQQPDDHPLESVSEDCLVMRPTGFWNDQICGDRLPALCERY